MRWAFALFAPLLGCLVLLVYVGRHAIQQREAARFFGLVIALWLASSLCLVLLMETVYPPVFGTVAATSNYERAIALASITAAHAIVFLPTSLVLFGFGTNWPQHKQIAVAVGLGAIAAFFAPPILIALSCLLAGECQL